MRRFPASAFAIAAAFVLAACDDARVHASRTGSVPVIPAPASVEAGNGAFQMDSRTAIAVTSPEGEAVARHFADLLGRTTGMDLRVELRSGAAQPESGVVFSLTDREGVRDEEGYSLEVSPRRIAVSAGSPRGLFYGAVTLWQLATAERASLEGAAGVISIPAVAIEDAPRFRWRGVMLDVARHYMPPEDIRRVIDWMSLHKLNTLHWHLTDDQGWRLEIRKYPRLTEIGAWRTPAGAAGRDARTGKPVRQGGFYTQDEVRDLVRYAAERHVTIVPEIEMPGHAQAAIAAYPRLGTEPDSQLPVSPDWGIHTVIFNVEEDTFRFLEDVLDEVLELFPGTYIHVGGDEAVKDRWEASARVQERMRELGVPDEEKLQGYFVARIGKFLAARGRRLVGWDEILEGGVPQGATVMSWRGTAGAIGAARLGHDVISATDPVMYMDHLQSDSPDEPPGRPSLVTLADVHAFDPVPQELSQEQARYVLGAQLNAWTEHMRTTERVEHALFPRVAALAEVTWSPTRREFADFVARLHPQLARYEKLGIRYARTALDPHATAERLRNSQPLRRRDEEMKACSNKLALHLEDDAPASGDRPVFLVDIMDPCWIYERAALDGVKRVAVTVGQVPYNFQLWRDAENVVIRPATPPGGSLELRKGTCDGPTLASIPLAAAVGNDELTRLEAEVAPASGSSDICLWFATGSVDPLWVIDRVELLTH
jgi:hexosaminidase